MRVSKKYILFFILVASIFLRLWRIDEVPVSLFGDELDVGYHAYSILKTGKDYSGNSWPLHFESYSDLRTPLYIYSAVPTVAVFGITPLGVRLPAVIFGVLGVWGMYLLVAELLSYQAAKRSKYRIPNTEYRILALLSAALLALSPWHIQYSRGGFEVTMLLAFLIFGLYLFFKSLKNGKWLWLSAGILAVTPLIYSTAKLFTPVLLVFMFLVWKKEILNIPFNSLKKAVLVLILLGGLTSYATLFSGGGQRFSYISVFTDPVTETEVDYARLSDAIFRQTMNITSYAPKAISRLVHNKYTYWGLNVITNYFKSFSTEFLFIKGDLNLRHSIEGGGQFYKVEAIALILGLVSFFALFKDNKIKKLIAFWILVGVIPSAITRDGGTHATRLILILPPLVILIAFGLVEGTRVFFKRYHKLLLTTYIILLAGCFGLYQHSYWVHNPWHSERWWHAGYKEVVEVIKQSESNYEKIVISNAKDKPQIFFAAYSQFDPKLWQRGMEVKTVNGFGELENIDKYYFGQVSGGIDGLSENMDDDVLYIAAAREVVDNLAKEPQKTPQGLKLIEIITYPSGEPAFYFLERSDDFSPETLEQSLESKETKS